MAHHHRPLGFGLLALAAALAPHVAVAQENPPHRGRAVRHHRVVMAAAPVPYRGLTINRAPAYAPGADPDQDIYRDGHVRYNDIRDFSPAPYTTSGVQFPYGLDGIGGYGSNFDYGAGEDSALLDRGAGTAP